MAKIEAVQQQAAQEGLKEVAKNINRLTGDKKDEEQQRRILAAAESLFSDDSDETTGTGFAKTTKLAEERPLSQFSENTTTDSDASTEEAHEPSAFDRLSAMLHKVRPSTKPDTSKEPEQSRSTSSWHQEVPEFSRSEVPKFPESTQAEVVSQLPVPDKTRIPERLAGHPLVEFIFGNEKQLLNISSEFKISNEDISEPLRTKLKEVIAGGGLYGSLIEAESSEPMSLTFLPIGPSVTAADRILLLSLQSTFSANESRGSSQNPIPQEFCLYYKRVSDRLNSGYLVRKDFNGLTTHFNTAGTYSTAARIWVGETKYDNSSAAATLSPTPLSSERALNRREIVFPLSGQVLSTTLAGIDNLVNAFYKSTDVQDYNEHYFSQLLIQPYIPGDKYTEFSHNSNPINTLSINTLKALEKFRSYSNRDMTVVFTPQVVDELIQKSENLSFSLNVKELPKLVFLGNNGRAVAETLLKANKDANVVVFLPGKQKEHTASSYPLVFDGKQQVAVYPYYYKKQLIGGGMKPYEGSIR
jgi:hypothetical protein